VDPFKAKKRGKPEDEIKEAIVHFLTCRGWFCKVTHGNMYQSGFPDVYACHPRYGSRWIEVKNPGKYAFTQQQLEDFPKFVAHGVGIWVLVAATEDEYQKLFKPCNWWHYLSIMK
jgi:hypothetical protein